MSGQQESSGTAILGLRLAIGLGQGAALYVLLEMLQGTVGYDIEGTKLTIFQGTDGLTFTAD